ncbi:MAG: IS30 family transposase [Pegethrix bostrychoides GSE-TBD4-15B]|jgi:IS30 family transposase|uniref:IS30 family transposase n=1 Tax=Pegethrix bostrychoides GSE-TBD4-15B TaxID=2839662 RepID=A0A951P9F6_9CYAN|nr:IS30 family transposase [Pegethrix bostrychoides GSE-TBD4-15B]
MHLLARLENLLNLRNQSNRERKGRDNQVETITFDNGKEFSRHEALARILDASCCYANLYCSWESGLNEHPNELLRQFLPKETDFREVSQKEVDKAVKLINQRAKALRLSNFP